MKNKIVRTFQEAVADIPDGSTIMIHSFAGPGGIAQNLIQELRDQGAKELTLIGCNLGQLSGVGLLEYQESVKEEIRGLRRRMDAHLLRFPWVKAIQQQPSCLKTIRS